MWTKCTNAAYLIDKGLGRGTGGTTGGITGTGGTTGGITGTGGTTGGITGTGGTTGGITGTGGTTGGITGTGGTTGGITGTGGTTGGITDTAGAGVSGGKMHSSSSLSDSESLMSGLGDGDCWSASTAKGVEASVMSSRCTAAQGHQPVAESCRRGCQRVLMSPDVAQATRSLGFCCGPVRSCIHRHGRPPGAHGQRLPCPCSRPSWLQLASAGLRPCGAPPAGRGSVAAPSQLSLLQCEQDVPAGHPPAIGAPVQRAGSKALL